ncbi:MAG: ABC transporter permease [Haloferacaceae archaeon]
MLEITRYESKRRVRGAFLMTVGFVLLAGLYIGLFPSFAESSVEIEQYVQNLPESFRNAFSMNLGTIEGFLAVELYQFLWLLLFGVYVAYSGGGLVAADVERGRMDLLLAAPVSRTRVVVEKYLSLLVPIVMANLLLPLAVWGGVRVIDETISLPDLFATHLLSVPYLMVCAGVGLALSVLFDRADIAQRGGIAAIFGLFLVDTVSTDTDYEWLGVLSPTRYYDPAEVLVDGTYDVSGALILLAGALALLLVSTIYFQRRDIN